MSLPAVLSNVVIFSAPITVAYIVKVEKLVKIVTDIKNSGNFFYKHRRYFLAGRKYRKAIEYINWFIKNRDSSFSIFRDASFNKIRDGSMMGNQSLNHGPFKEIQIDCLSNLSAVDLQRHRYKDCIQHCNEVLALDENNIKAIFRKGQANIALNNQEEGLEHLRRAHRLVPYDKKIISEIRKVKNSMRNYLDLEKQRCAKMFRVHT